MSKNNPISEITRKISTPAENKRIDRLVKLGFKEGNGIFYIDGVISFYWEQLHYANNRYWRSYMLWVHQVIHEKQMKNGNRISETRG